MTYIKIIRHGCLNYTFKNKQESFPLCTCFIKLDILVQKVYEKITIFTFF